MFLRTLLDQGVVKVHILLLFSLLILIAAISVVSSSPIEIHGLVTKTISIEQGAQSAEDGQFYEPAQITINPGDAIIWKNEDIALHTATSGSDAPDGKFDTGLISSNDSSQPITMPSEPGQYQYFCTLHPWMRGVVKVQSSTSG
jgi:plastocyanin